MNIQDITPAQVLRAYSGKRGCMCGCLGEYFDYDRDFSQVTKILRTIQSADSPELDEDILHADMGDRTFAVYLKPTAKGSNR